VSQEYGALRAPVTKAKAHVWQALYSVCLGSCPCFFSCLDGATWCRDLLAKGLLLSLTLGSEIACGVVSKVSRELSRCSLPLALANEVEFGPTSNWQLWSNHGYGDGYVGLLIVHWSTGM
jgi:hypothetical protein